MKNEKGAALIVVVIVTILLTLLGLSMTYSSMAEFSISHSLENQYKAFLVAEAGMNTHKETIRGQDLSSLLSSTAEMPEYISYSTPPTSSVAYSYFSRNPQASLQALNVDFENPPSLLGPRTVNGLLSPTAGTSLGSGQRYWAKLTDNQDEAPYGLPDDPQTDRDGSVYLRVMGISRLGAGSVSTYGGTVKNSLSILEARFKRDMTLDVSAPFALYSSAPPLPANGSQLFDGSAFRIDGYDHPTMTLADLKTGSHSHVTGGDSAGIEVINDDPGGGDATVAASSLYSSLSSTQQKRITGNTSDFAAAYDPASPIFVPIGTPSLRDATQEIRSDPNADASNIFDAGYVMNFINNLASFADVTLAHGTNASGRNFGDDANPRITYCEGDCTLGGGGIGAGLLVVKGRLSFNANFTYRGLILVVGEGVVNMSGSNVGLLGGLLVAKTVENPDGTYSYGVPSLTVAGNSTLYYQSNGIRLGYSLMPVRTAVWREINPEIEPQN